MGVQHEKPFETEICEYLGAHGWLYEDPDKKNRRLSLIHI